MLSLFFFNVCLLYIRNYFLLSLILFYYFLSLFLAFQFFKPIFPTLPCLFLFLSLSYSLFLSCPLSYLAHFDLLYHSSFTCSFFSFCYMSFLFNDSTIYSNLFWTWYIAWNGRDFLSSKCTSHDSFFLIPNQNIYTTMVKCVCVCGGGRWSEIQGRTKTPMNLIFCFDTASNIDYLRLTVKVTWVHQILKYVISSRTGRDRDFETADKTKKGFWSHECWDRWDQDDVSHMAGSMLILIKFCIDR